jgi:hypothetical protein
LSLSAKESVHEENRNTPLQEGVEMRVPVEPIASAEEELALKMRVSSDGTFRFTVPLANIGTLCEAATYDSIPGESNQEQ